MRIFFPRALTSIVAFTLLAALAGANTAPAPVAPKEHQRGAEQTFLTYPEWFLVFSPAEYAVYVKDHTPTQFPFIGHIRQFWQSYGNVYTAANDGYPFNFGYHVMIMVIGVSTSVEYAIRSAYETLIGRLSELTQSHSMTAEDRFAAHVAQDYVDFIRVLPWYEYDFTDKLARLWKVTDLWGPDAVRKWERKYALTTEYGIKAVYGWLIKKATKASYDELLLVTAVVVDRLPSAAPADLPDLKVLQRFPDGAALITVPRYDAFMKYATALAAHGAGFLEIAGNRTLILISVLVPHEWEPAPNDLRLLFSQPIITQPAIKRVALVVPVASLAATLNSLAQRGYRLEHIYDY